MCNIFRFLPGQMMDEEKFFNCVYNNWHSYGYVIKDGSGGMDVNRIVPESGENDPKELWKIIKDNMDMERYLHVRHNTAGATTLENCHPIPVLFIPAKGKRKSREIVFMHNGTMGDYKSKIYNGTVAQDDPNGPSDTVNFVEQVLTPVIQADYGTGVGDLNNPVLRQILQRFWPYSNRGVLIANDQPSLYFGDWKEYGIGDIIKVSTTDYFDKVSRGPEWSRREAAKRAETEANRFRKPNTSESKMFCNLKDYNFEDPHGFYKLSESPVNIVNDWDLYDRDHCVSVGLLTHDEIKSIYADETTMVHLADWVFTDYKALYDEHMETKAKLEKATQRIAGMAEELKKRNQSFLKNTTVG